MKTFDFQPASRQGIKPLVGLYGTSNSGKTLSALLLARGFAGPNGKVILGDTESGRGALYADMVPGGYLRCDIEPPFSPDTYTAFLDAAEAAEADAIVIDSFSHEWEGDGGVCDMAGDIEQRTGKTGLHCWKGPKMAHAKLILRLMRSKTFVIVCLRAKFKSRQVRDAGKTAIVKDDHVTPVQSEDFIFELTAHAEMQPSKPGSIRLTKWSVPDLADCFPKDGTDLLSVSHGEAIARWASGGTPGKPQPQTVAAQGLSRADTMAKIWSGVEETYGSDKAAFQEDLIRREWLAEGETFNRLSLPRLHEVAGKLGVQL